MTPLRMNAYYFGFSETKVRVVDEVLSAVACAGKAYHHTESWTDSESGELSHAEEIQAAAGRAAKEIERLRGHLETVGMHLHKIDRDGPPDSQERVRALAEQCELALKGAA